MDVLLEPNSETKKESIRDETKTAKLSDSLAKNVNQSDHHAGIYIQEQLLNELLEPGSSDDSNRVKLEKGKADISNAGTSQYLTSLDDIKKKLASLSGIDRDNERLIDQLMTTINVGHSPRTEDIDTTIAPLPPQRTVQETQPGAFPQAGIDRRQSDEVSISMFTFYNTSPQAEDIEAALPPLHDSNSNTGSEAMKGSLKQSPFTSGWRSRARGRSRRAETTKQIVVPDDWNILYARAGSGNDHRCGGF